MLEQRPRRGKKTNIGLNWIKFNFINEICLMAMVPHEGDVDFLILGEFKSSDYTRNGSQYHAVKIV